MGYVVGRRLLTAPAQIWTSLKRASGSYLEYLRPATRTIDSQSNGSDVRLLKICRDSTWLGRGPFGSQRMYQRPTPERPTADREVTPPRYNAAQDARGESQLWISIRTRQGRSWSSSATPGAFVTILVLLLVTTIAIVMLLAVLGMVLLWIPVLGLVFALLFLSGILRTYVRQLRR